MNEKYLDIIEKSLLAYSSEQISDYVDEVKHDGLSEHGFPRLAANIGILIAYGRRTDLMGAGAHVVDVLTKE